VIFWGKNDREGKKYGDAQGQYGRIKEKIVTVGGVII